MVLVLLLFAGNMMVYSQYTKNKCFFVVMSVTSVRAPGVEIVSANNNSHKKNTGLTSKLPLPWIISDPRDVWSQEGIIYNWFKVYLAKYVLTQGM